MTLYEKTMKVIKSCSTTEQLKTAEKYVNLFLKQVWSTSDLIIPQIDKIIILENIEEECLKQKEKIKKGGDGTGGI